MYAVNTIPPAKVRPVMEEALGLGRCPLSVWSATGDLLRFTVFKTRRAAGLYLKTRSDKYLEDATLYRVVPAAVSSPELLRLFGRSSVEITAKRAA